MSIGVDKIFETDEVLLKDLNGLMMRLLNQAWRLLFKDPSMVRTRSITADDLFKMETQLKHKHR